MNVERNLIEKCNNLKTHEDTYRRGTMMNVNIVERNLN